MKNPRLSAFYKYIFSSILSTFGYSCYVLVDTIVLAQVSDFAIAALNIVLPAYQLILAVGSMIGIGASTHYAILRAEKKLKDGSMYFTIAMISGTIFAASATILMIAFRTPLLIALGANSETLKLASDYLIGYVLLAVFNVASIVITGFIRCDGAPRLAGTASLVGSLSNILLDVVFVYGLRWGMFGAAFATGLSPVVTLICCCPYFIKKQNQFKLTAVTEPAKRIFDILKLGFPSFIAGIASSFTMLVFNKQLLKLGGNLALTAYGILVNLSVIFNCLNNGITQGVGPLFSDSFGRKDSVSLSYFIRITIIAVVFCFILSYGLTLIFPDFLIGIFNPENDLELAVLAKEGMLIYFTGFIFTGFAHVFSTYFVSVNSPLPSTIISILQTGIVITPIVLILPVFFNLTGVWLAYPVAEGLVLIVSLSLFIYKRKMLKL